MKYIFLSFVKLELANYSPAPDETPAKRNMCISFDT